jgi:Ca2+-binding EF-hand superfamily protein
MALYFKAARIAFIEFAQQLSRVGVGADVARKLFDSFDKSKDGSLSMNEFVDGVTADNASGSSTFQDLAASNETDEATMTSFLNKGSGAADQYWNGIRGNAKSLLAIA